MTSPSIRPLTAAVAAFATERYPEIPIATDAPLSTFWSELRAAGVASPGDEFVDWVDIGLVGGVFLPLFANCVDLRSAIHVLARYHPLIDDNAIVEVAVLPDDAIDVKIVTAAGGRPDLDSLQTFSRLLEHVVAGFVGSNPAPFRIDGGLRFTPELLAKPMVSADPRIAALLKPMAEGCLADQRNEIVAQVRAMIQAAGLGAVPSLADVARELACSTRSLQQQLVDGDTTYSGLVDDERRATALSLLANLNRSITEVAFTTGFRSLEGFGRAVRRWTGLSPTAWRRQHMTRG